MKFNGIIKYFDSARFIQLEHILIWLQSLFQENYDAKHIYHFRNFESFPKLMYIHVLGKEERGCFIYNCLKCLDISIYNIIHVLISDGDI